MVQIFLNLANYASVSLRDALFLISLILPCSSKNEDLLTQLDRLDITLIWTSFITRWGKWYFKTYTCSFSLFNFCFGAAEQVRQLWPLLWVLFSFSFCVCFSSSALCQVVWRVGCLRTVIWLLLFSFSFFYIFPSWNVLGNMLVFTPCRFAIFCHLFPIFI